MATKLFLAIVVFCAVIVKSDNGHSYKMPEYVRIKRAKYYSSPPIKFYRPPPPPHPVKGYFSYTPPPNYMEKEDPLHPGSFKPYKASNRPSNDGLADKDINNLVKHLSKKDLDKIIDIAGEKYRQPPFESSNNPHDDVVKEVDNIIFKQNVRDFESERKFSLNGPYVRGNKDHSNHDDVQYSDASQYVEKITKIPNHSEEFVYRGPYAPGAYIEQIIPTHHSNPPQMSYRRHQDLSGVQLDSQESIKNSQFSFVESYIQQDLNNNRERDYAIAIDGNRAAQEDQLPKPVNLRDSDDYTASNTNNVPSIVKSNSYKIENFGDLPLMDYHSKLHSVSSYHVPHYSVLSPSNQASPSSSQLRPSPSALSTKVPKLEFAPPPSAAHEQSDAHLKAIKIWTHHSKGTAYTLHDDGTLSLEKVPRPKPIYGPY